MQARRSGEQGFMLLGVIVACFLLLLALSVAAPMVAHQLRRDKEVEAVHRGNQYVRAIQVYYRKFGHYPSSIDQLEKTNNIRFLRQKYLNPLTGKDDWRLIHVGEAKTTVKSFFGQPLSGLPGNTVTPSPAGGSGMTGSSSMNGTATTGSSGATSAFGTSGSSSFGGTSSFGSSASGGSSTTGGSGTPGSTSSGSTGDGTGNTPNTSSTGMNAGGGMIMGIGVSKPGDSIVDPNQQTTYGTWEFIYDPRIELLKAKAAMGSGSVSGNGMGSGNTMGSGNGMGSTGSSPFGATPGTPTSGSTSSGTTTPGSGTPGGTTP